jgi:hypothetical protein
MANALKVDEYYTYTDYLTWDEDERYELIDGIPYMMAPLNRTGQGHYISSVLFCLISFPNTRNSRKRL